MSFFNIFDVIDCILYNQGDCERTAYSSQDGINVPSSNWGWDGLHLLCSNIHWKGADLLFPRHLEICTHVKSQSISAIW